jgi:hypothetical protein
VSTTSSSKVANATSAPETLPGGAIDGVTDHGAAPGED